MVTPVLNNETRKDLLRAIEAVCKPPEINEIPQGFQNINGDLDPESEVIFDPESEVIFDPESEVIFDPRISLNPSDGEPLAHFSGNIYDSYGNKIDKLGSLCDLLRLLHWLLRYDDLINPGSSSRSL